MKDDDDGEFYVEPEVEEVREIKQLEAPIALYDKPAREEPRHIALKILEVKKDEHIPYTPFKLEKKYQTDSEDEENIETWSDSPFLKYYAQATCLYQRLDNRSFNRFNHKTYFSGVFLHHSIFANGLFNETNSLQGLVQEYYQTDNSQLPKPDSGQLRFDSNFDSGNLFAAFKVGSKQYDLIMQSDLNSRGNNQWFYFSVRGMELGEEYTFNVVNFTKSDSLFNYGLLPCICFCAEDQAPEEGRWFRDGKEVVYKKGRIRREGTNRYYYQLSFKFLCTKSAPVVYFAYTYPYPYSRINELINDRVARNSDLVVRLRVGRTLSKRNIEALQICAPFLGGPKKKDTRKAIVVMARQHPGETQGSYVCQGVIDRLLAKCREAEFLRKNYIFIVIPMLNPDGVSFGHYRTNLAGKDLNRKWDSSEKEQTCPQVVSVKAYLQELSKERDIRFVIDLHGHSKKLNSFFYGNPCNENPEVVRIFPFACSKLSPAVQFEDCTFNIDQYKKNAARVFLSQSYRQLHVYTFESSFYAYVKNGKKVEFNPKQYRSLGETVVNALFLQLEHQVRFQQSFQFNLSRSNSKQFALSPFVKMLVELKASKSLLETGAKADSGSDSHPEQNEVNNNDIQKQQPIAKPVTIVQAPPSPAELVVPTQSSQKLSRNGSKEAKELREPIKPQRIIRFLEISQVNAILPDKYQLGLQPIRKKEPPPSAVPQRQEVKPIPKISVDSQTEKMEVADCSKNDIELTNNLSCSYKCEETPQSDRRYSTVIRAQNRNNLIFRIDFVSEQRQPVHRRIESSRKTYPRKHAFSQTVLNGGHFGFMRSKNPSLPQVESVPLQFKSWGNNPAQKQESARITSKRETTDIFLSGIVQKYLSERQPLSIVSKGIERPSSIPRKPNSKRLN